MDVARASLRADWLARIEAHPGLLCGFRPFFVLTAGSAVLFMALWLAALAGGLPGLQRLPGGALAWHAHELVFGFGMASIAGFLLTAVPEFTGCAPFTRRTLLSLALLWICARLAFVLAPAWPAATRRASRAAPSACFRIRRASARKLCPAGVSRTERLVRSNKATSRMRSRICTCRLKYAGSCSAGRRRGRNAAPRR